MLNFKKLIYTLTLPMVAVIVFVSVSVSVVTYWSIREEAKDQIDRSHASINGQIQLKMEQFLTTPHLINRLNRIEVQSGFLDFSDQEELARHFWQQIQIFEKSSYIYAGNTKGGFAGAGQVRLSDNTYTLEMTPNFTAGSYDVYIADDQGNKGELLSSKPGYDARKRPWYTAAVEKRGPAWSDVFLEFTSMDLTIAATLPAYDQNDRFIGVFSNEVPLSELAEFLENLEISQNGVAYILEADGDILFSSNPENLYRPIDEGFALYNLLDTPVPILQAVRETIRDRRIELLYLTKTRSFTTTLAGEKYYVRLDPYRDEYGMNWRIMTIIPEKDFQEAFTQARNFALLLLTISLAAGIGTGLIVSNQVVGPIQKLNRVAKRIANGDRNVPLPLTRRQDELGELSRSFVTMAESVQLKIEELETEVHNRMAAEQQVREANTDLEQAIKSRTLELENSVKALQEAQMQLIHSEKMTTASKLVSDVAHELNTPLGIGITTISFVRSQLERADEMGQDDLFIQEMKLSLNMAHRNLKKVADMIESFKFLAAETIMEKSDVDLYGIISKVFTKYSEKMNEKHIRYSISCSKAIHFVSYPEAFEKIIENLLENSIIHGFEERKFGEIRVEVNMTSSELELIYTDNGNGADSDNPEMLLEPFYTTKRNAGCSGLGLTLVHNLITQRLEGSIRMKTDRGKGMSVTITIPVSSLDFL